MAQQRIVLILLPPLSRKPNGLKHPEALTPSSSTLSAFGAVHAIAALISSPRIGPMTGFIADSVTAVAARLTLHVGISVP